MAGNSPVKGPIKPRKPWSSSLLYRTQLCWQKAGLADKSRVEWMIEPVQDDKDADKYKFGMRCNKCIQHKEDPTVKGRGGPSSQGRHEVRIESHAHCVLP